MKWFPKYNFILASKSPRRQELLRSLGIQFRIMVQDGDEDYPDSLPKEEIPVFLARQKAQHFIQKLDKNDLLITADTIVWLNGAVLGKPRNKTEAIKTLQNLSGQEHQVISGVCLSSVQKQKSFYSVTNVKFKELSLFEIEYYIDEFKPYDKAGSYGIQEWIGYIGITHIEGSFYNVMGLPIQQLYTEICNF
jgi:septum formation protein